MVFVMHHNTTGALECSRLMFIHKVLLQAASANLKSIRKKNRKFTLIVSSCWKSFRHWGSLQNFRTNESPSHFSATFCVNIGKREGAWKTCFIFFLNAVVLLFNVTLICGKPLRVSDRIRHQYTIAWNSPSFLSEECT